MRKSQSSSNTQAWIFIIMGAIFTAVAVTILLASQSEDPALLDFLFPTIFGLIGLIMLGYGGLGMVSRMRLGQPEIALTHTSLPVGGTTLFTLQHTFPREIELESIHLKLVMKEIATYKQGTKTRTVTHDHIYDEQEWPGQAYYEGQQLHLQRDLAIPRDGMHSFKVTRNEIQWVCQVRIGIPRLPDYQQEIILDVRPQLAP